MSPSYVLGMDVGTSGVRCLVVDKVGRVVAQGSSPLPAPKVEVLRHEQDAELWWTGTTDALKRTFKDLKANGGRPENILSLCIAATSGTIVPVDETLKPLRLGIMYNDVRAHEEAEQLNTLGEERLVKLGYRFNASFGLAKILWLIQNEPDVMEKAYCVVHQADFITSRLCEAPNRYGMCLSDESNALKSGYDIVARCWPEYISKTGIDMTKLPEIKKIGQPLGTVSKDVAKDLGLNPECVIVGGMTDILEAQLLADKVITL